MPIPAPPEQICNEFAELLRNGRISRVEQFLKLQRTPPDELAFERLIATEIDYHIETQRAVHEQTLLKRFTDHPQLVRDVFREARARHSNVSNLLIPDPNKTSLEFVFENLMQSTNVAFPGSFLELDSELEEPPLPAEVKLRIVKGPHEGREICYENSASVIVGRGTDAQLSLPKDDRCSRLHCRFEINPPLCTVIDLKSTNGTLVNGRRIDRTNLQDEDSVQVGTSKIRVHIRNQTEGSTMQPIPDTFNPLLDAPDIPGYDVEYQLGVGNFGVVYAGQQTASGIPVAIKLLCASAVPDHEEMRQFMNEASVSSRLRHPNIVRTIDFGMQETTPYLILERVPTINIRQYLQELDTATRCREAVQLVAMVMDGLACAHGEGIVHRDIKLPNLLFYQDGERPNVKISDFGLAVKSAGSFRSQESICGTVAYMAPEMIASRAGTSELSDIYAAGVCMYELISDRRPHEAQKISKLTFMIQNEPATRISERHPGLPESLTRLVDKAIARNPAHRFQSAADMRDALLSWLK